MSQNHSGNYMDGVPVKISEKYKPPPRIALPSGLLEKLNSSAELVESISYDFSLENNVLKKLEEWQNAKQAERNERNHRLQLREEARQRELDSIAATETEERLKQLSISEVSYPSTEEISEISPDDGAECKPPEVDNCTPMQSVENAEKVTASNSENAENLSDKVYQYGAHVKYLEKTKYETNSEILQPTPVSPNRTYPPTNLLDDPDPIKQLQNSIQNKSNTKSFLHKPFYVQNNIDNLTFSDFENDTSSPFDNMELKTINDIELLAQVLTSHQSTVNSQSVESDNMAVDNYPNMQMCDLNSGNMYSNTHSTSAGSDIYSHNLAYTSHSTHSGIEKPFSGAVNCVPMTNGYYDSSGGKVTSYANIGMNNINAYYSPKYGYTMTNPVYQQVSNASYNQSIPETYNYSKPGEQNINSDNYQREQNVPYNQTVKNTYDYYNMEYVGYPHEMKYAHYQSPSTQVTQKSEQLKGDADDLKFSKSRSRSVPDIVKELDNEVAGSRLRSRERSHNSSPASSYPLRRPIPSTSQSLKREDPCDPYDKLSQSLQEKCRHISGMGFPLDRVARACEGFGEDDKKMIEYLLVMGELMDLGFLESKVEKALLQNNCNRDKALDELLIS